MFTAIKAKLAAFRQKVADAKSRFDAWMKASTPRFIYTIKVVLVTIFVLIFLTYVKRCQG